MGSMVPINFHRIADLLKPIDLYEDIIEAINGYYRICAINSRS